MSKEPKTVLYHIFGAIISTFWGFHFRFSGSPEKLLEDNFRTFVEVSTYFSATDQLACGRVNYHFGRAFSGILVYRWVGCI